MSFDEGDHVRLQDKHSDHDGDVGEITQVMQTMFDDETYTVSFDDGQEAGVPPDQLEPAEASESEDTDETDDTDEE